MTSLIRSSSETPSDDQERGTGALLLTAERSPTLSGKGEKGEFRGFGLSRDPKLHPPKPELNFALTSRAQAQGSERPNTFDLLAISSREAEEFTDVSVIRAAVKRYASTNTWLCLS